MEKSSNMKMRYGRVRQKDAAGANPRRSVLLTTREDDEVFFGISKCNVSEDKWDRKEGQRWAQQRLNLALRSRKQQTFPVINGVSIGPSGMFGSCDVKNIISLLDYFRDVTDTTLDIRALSGING